MNMYTMSMSGRGCVAYGGEEKDGTEEWERLRGFGGEEKMALKKIMFLASLRDAFPFQNG